MSEVSLSERKAIAKTAYIYGVPMVGTWKTMYAFSIDKANPQYKGPFNTILNIARVFTPDDTAFVTPNSDTPYTFAGLDVRAEPVVITMPKMEKERYFVFQLMDLYTFNFAYIGSRTTGNDGGTFLIAGPEWKERCRPDITKVLRCRNRPRHRCRTHQLFNAGRSRQREADPGRLQSAAAVCVPWHTRRRRHLLRSIGSSRCRQPRTHFAGILQSAGLPAPVRCAGSPERDGTAREFRDDRDRARQAV